MEHAMADVRAPTAIGVAVREALEWLRHPTNDVVGRGFVWLPGNYAALPVPRANAATERCRPRAPNDSISYENLRISACAWLSSSVLTAAYPWYASFRACGGAQARLEILGFRDGFESFGALVESANKSLRRRLAPKGTYTDCRDEWTR